MAMMLYGLRLHGCDVVLSLSISECLGEGAGVENSSSSQISVTYPINIILGFFVFFSTLVVQHFVTLPFLMIFLPGIDLSMLKY